MLAGRGTRAIVLTTLLLSSAGAARSQSAISPSQRAGEEWHRELVDAIATGRRREVAAAVRYPLRVIVPGLGSPVSVPDLQAMLRMYDLFFTPEMRCAIEQSRIPAWGAPRPKHVLLIGEGVVTMADGRIVAERTAGSFKVTRMTIVGESARPRAPRTVVFLKNDDEVQLAGRLNGDEVDTYIVSARAGDRLQLRIERFPGRALMLRVTRGQTGDLLRGAATEYARAWTAPLPETGEYRVEVVRRLAYCAPAVTYLLTIARHQPPRRRPGH
jgi:hypothetical protein